MRSIFGDRERSNTFQNDFPYPIELNGIDFYEEIPGSRCVFVVKEGDMPGAREVKMGTTIVAASVQDPPTGPVLILHVPNFLIFDRVAEHLLFAPDSIGVWKWWLAMRWVIDKKNNHITAACPLTYLEIITP